MAQGTIKKIVEDKGFGFIERPGTKDIFFHATSLKNRDQFTELTVGQAVTFDEETSDKGPRASNVAPV